MHAREAHARWSARAWKGARVRALEGRLPMPSVRGTRVDHALLFSEKKRKKVRKPVAKAPELSFFESQKIKDGGLHEGHDVIFSFFKKES